MILGDVSHLTVITGKPRASGDDPMTPFDLRGQGQ